MEIRQLEWFVVLARHLHFGRAAEELFIAQPQLSNQIIRLERDLGLQLFRRTSRSVELSGDGQALLPIARRVVTDVAYLRDSARLLTQNLKGLLRIGFTFSALQWGLGEQLRAFHRKHPDVAIEAEQRAVLSQVEAIRTHELDLGFIIGAVVERDLVVRELTREPLLAVLPADHRLADEAVVDLGDLQSEEFIGFAPTAVHDYITDACLTAGFMPQVSRQGPQVQTAIHMVTAGFGVTLAPTWDCRTPVDGTVYRPLTNPSLHLSLSAVHSTDPDSSTLARSLVAMLLDRAASQVPTSPR